MWSKILSNPIYTHLKKLWNIWGFGFHFSDIIANCSIKYNPKNTQKEKEKRMKNIEN